MSRMLTLTALMVLFTLAAPPDVAAQEMAEEESMATDAGMPDGWMVRFDRPDAGADVVDFRIMEPGWHVTTGRAGAGVYWRSGMTASGEYTVSTQMHLFNPASHAEAFGLFMGGENLDGADQAYVYFLVRQTGEYLIKRRMGSQTETVVGWTAHDAIPEMAPGAGDPTEYDLSVAVGHDEVAFSVNGTTVHTLARSEVDTDGQVGLRVNHVLDLHIQKVELDPTGMDM